MRVNARLQGWVWMLIDLCVYARCLKLMFPADEIKCCQQSNVGTHGQQDKHHQHIVRVGAWHRSSVL